MGYVSGFENDIFVSYANVDDDPPFGVEHGWVTAFVANLERRLGQLLGRRECFKVWIDQNLSHHVQITPEIFGALDRTATLIVILSPGYLASDWCRRERRNFLQMLKTRIDGGSRVFMVERDRVTREERPPEFGDLLGYRFWEELEGGGIRILGDPAPGPEDKAYYANLDRLARDLSKELKRMQSVAAVAVPSPAPQAPILAPVPAPATPVVTVETASPPLPAGADSRRTIYLAEVTDDLAELRDEIRAHLDQHDFRVLPDVWYPRGKAEFEAAVGKDLAQCTLFVQPLGAFPGRKPPGTTTSYAAVQHQVALDLNKPVLQWRAPQLDLNSITDPAHRKLLEGCHVQAVDIADFKREVLRAIEVEVQRSAQNRQPGVRPEELMVFVHSVAEDREQAESLAQALTQRGCAWVLPKREGRPEEIRKDLEANLLDCDGVIVVYGQITNSWVRDQLRQCQKLTWRREKPLRAVAIYEAPPAPKEPVNMGLQNLQLLKHGEKHSPESLTPFLAAMGVQ